MEFVEWLMREPVRIAKFPGMIVLSVRVLLLPVGLFDLYTAHYSMGRMHSCFPYALLNAMDPVEQSMSHGSKALGFVLLL